MFYVLPEAPGEAGSWRRRAWGLIHPGSSWTDFAFSLLLHADEVTMKEMGEKSQQLRAGEVLIIVVVLFMWAGQLLFPLHMRNCLWALHGQTLGTPTWSGPAPARQSQGCSFSALPHSLGLVVGSAAGTCDGMCFPQCFRHGMCCPPCQPMCPPLPHCRITRVWHG